MIGIVVAAFQLSHGTPPSALVVHDARRSIRVALTATPAGPMLRPEALAPVLRVNVRHDSSSWYTLEAWGTRVQLQAGSRLVRVGNDVRQLSAAPMVASGRLMVPLQLVAAVFPEFVPNTRWDADAGQLVVFSTDIAAPTVLAQRAAPPATSSEAAPTPLTTSVQYDDGVRRPAAASKHGRLTVIVDAGHGGVDNGMTGPIGGGPKICEKDITLAVAKKLGARLQARGLEVVYTRTTDTLIALDDRGRIANRNGGDLFISIHVNAANLGWKDPEAARGVETYFLSEARTEDARRVERMENAAVRFEQTGPELDTGNPLSFILSDMQQNEHLRESSQLADIIQRRLSSMSPGPSRGVKQAGFRVLVTAFMPAVLVEIGFGTNGREARYLSDPAKQDAIAAAIASGAQQYLDAYERRVEGGKSGTGGSQNR
jgi:N-acetylmuramoyl-L-alanine amidase